MALTVPVKDSTGKTVGELELDPNIFGVPAKTHVLHEAVRAERANRRVAIAHTKTRGEVRGGGKKPWKQKGTGRARHGSTRSPIWVGGGVTFGPRSNRNFSLKINKKIKRQALLMALSEKVKDGAFTVLDQFDLSEYKTKAVAALLKATGLSRTKTLLVLPGSSAEKTRKSAANIPTIDTRNANNFSLTDLLAHPHLLTTRAGAQTIQNIFGKKGA